MVMPLIAVIEDDEATLNCITECLMDEGYRTLAYDRGAGAYELIEGARPDAVILDIRLEHPRAGMAVLQRLRRAPATAAIPVLVCTADIPFTREWGRTLGEHGCASIAKPFEIDVLIATVGRLLRPLSEDPRATRRGDTEPMIRPVVGVVDVDGTGVSARTAQLEQKGYKVVACRWGDGIFDLAVREQPDVLLVDAGDRPRGAVSCALRRLGRDPLTRHIPLVVDPPRGGELYRQLEEMFGPVSAVGAPRRHS